MEKTEQGNVVIKPANLRVATFKIRGTAPLVQARFSKKGDLMAKMAQGSVAKGKKERTARDYEDEVEQAIHRSEEGWAGIHAGAFRASLISACRLVGFKMTLAKLSVFVVADGIDKNDGVPLVKITKGKHETMTMHVRNATGVCDVRARPMWREWECTLNIRFDADQFSLKDVANLLDRAGAQVGVGEGRPESKNSAGMGWGTFSVVP